MKEILACALDWQPLRSGRATQIPGFDYVTTFRLNPRIQPHAELPSSVRFWPKVDVSAFAGLAPPSDLPTWPMTGGHACTLSCRPSIFVGRFTSAWALLGFLVFRDHALLKDRTTTRLADALVAVRVATVVVALGIAILAMHGSPPSRG